MNPNINDEYWMRIAEQVAEASTCRKKVGCVLIQNNFIVGMGYVGSVHGGVHCNDVGCLFVESPTQGSENTGLRCVRTIHAEINAILKCNVRGDDNSGYISAYSTYAPCMDCTKALIQIGVRVIVFRNAYKDVNRDKYLDALNKEAWVGGHPFGTVYGAYRTSSPLITFRELCQTKTE